MTKETRPCPSCSKPIQVQALLCRHCQEKIDALLKVEFRTGHRTKDFKALVDARKKRPPEVTIALVYSGLHALVFLFCVVASLLVAEGSFLLEGLVVVEGLVLLGLWRRSIWGWWLAIIVYALRGWVPVQAWLSYGSLSNVWGGVVVVYLLGALASILILLNCRTRGAYRLVP